MGSTASITKRFAMAFSDCFDAKTAAMQIGIPPNEALAEGQRLIAMSATRRLVQRYCGHKHRLYDCARTGLEKIAFGSCNDVIKLAFAKEDELSLSFIQSLDLSLISSVKRDKDGGVDIKLFDRQKALEALMELNKTGSSESVAQSFLNALGADDEAE